MSETGGVANAMNWCGMLAQFSIWIFSFRMVGISRIFWFWQNPSADGIIDLFPDKYFSYFMKLPKQTDMLWMHCIKYESIWFLHPWHESRSNYVIKIILFALDIELKTEQQNLIEINFSIV